MLDGCGITRLSHGLAKIEKVKASCLRQRIREPARRAVHLIRKLKEKRT